jgi:hypothetical protein
MKNAGRNWHAVILAKTSVECLVQCVIFSQCATIHVDIRQKYLATQPLRHIHAKRNVKLFSVVATAALENVGIAIHQGCILSAFSKSN